MLCLCFIFSTAFRWDICAVTMFCLSDGSQKGPIGCYVVLSFRWQSDGTYRLLRCFVFHMAVRWHLKVVTLFCLSDCSRMGPIGC